VATPELPTSPPSGGGPGPRTRTDLAGVREANLSLVARTVFGAVAPPSRADVAAATSMTRSTVSRLVDHLVAGGVLVELDPVRKAGLGRPATPLVPASGRFVALGLQVNIGYLAALVLDLDGTVRARRTVLADLRGAEPGPVLDRLATLALETIDAVPGPRLVGAGVALPGIVSAGGGTLLRAPNLGWSDVDVVAALARGPVADVGVSVGNEADLAAATVSWSRPGVPGRLQDFLYVSGETGIGGSVVQGGTPLRGLHGWAGEIGHVSVDLAGPPCPCGSTGCVEQYAGKRALMTAAGLGADDPPARLITAVRHGDAQAVAAVDLAARALGAALAGVLNVVDLPVVVLGGHLREVSEVLLPVLGATLEDRVLSAAWVPPRVELAGDDPAPGALGAASLVLAGLLADPTPWIAGEPVP
jgi:predicted NBD/HSP70 family sugar kinase